MRLERRFPSSLVNTNRKSRGTAGAGVRVTAAALPRNVYRYPGQKLERKGSPSNRKGSRAKKAGSTRQSASSSRGYSRFTSFLVKLFRLSLSLTFLQGYPWSRFKGWRHLPKREILLRLPTVCKKSLHYLTVRTSERVNSVLPKRIKEGPINYWHQSVARTHGTATRVTGVSSKSSGESSRQKYLPFFNYFRSLKWFPIPLSLGFALLAYQHYGRVLRRAKKGQQTTQEEAINQDWEITCYRKIPWKSFSRAWGWINDITLPVWTREYVLGWYASVFHCDLDEAETDDLRAYKNLGEFFRRNLKEGMRPIHLHSPLVSPADGTIFHQGKVTCDVIEQVKGVRYSLKTFLGPEHKSMSIGGISAPDSKSDVSSDYCSRLLRNPKTNSLFYCVVYLAPGDYHRFHSPADWTVHFRRHFTGELLSVSPSVASWIGGLFSLNERAVYIGDWQHGFFSMTAVGATNVGSIRVYEDSALHTNVRGSQKNTQFEQLFEKPIKLRKGDCFGEFNLGSTIVIIFEAPNDFKFSSDPNRRIRVGEGLVLTQTPRS